MRRVLPCDEYCDGYPGAWRSDLLCNTRGRPGAPDAMATSGWGFSSAGAPIAFQESGCPLLQTLCAYMRLRVILWSHVEPPSPHTAVRQ